MDVRDYANERGCGLLQEAQRLAAVEDGKGWGMAGVEAFAGGHNNEAAMQMWIRSSLNERALGSRLRALANSPSLLQCWYSRWLPSSAHTHASFFCCGLIIYIDRIHFKEGIYIVSRVVQVFVSGCVCCESVQQHLKEVDGWHACRVAVLRQEEAAGQLLGLLMGLDAVRVLLPVETDPPEHSTTGTTCSDCWVTRCVTIDRQKHIWWAHMLLEVIDMIHPSIDLIHLILQSQCV